MANDKHVALLKKGVDAWNAWRREVENIVEEWDAKGQSYELAMCRTLALARAVFEVAIKEKPVGRFMIRSRTRVVNRHPEGDW